jgi:hypothetical protein
MPPRIGPVSKPDKQALWWIDHLDITLSACRYQYRSIFGTINGQDPDDIAREPAQRGDVQRPQHRPIEPARDVPCGKKIARCVYLLPPPSWGSTVISSHG